MAEVGVEDGEVGGEHGSGDFAAFGAVADEGVDEAGGCGGLDRGVRGVVRVEDGGIRLDGGGNRGQMIGYPCFQVP